jgi:hypothetical protein
LQQLALFAIPQIEYLEESDPEDVDSDVAHVSHAALLESVQTSEASSSADSLAVFDRLQENLSLSDADSADITVPPPLETGDGDDTFWDYVTPKYQEARAALVEGQTTNRTRDDLAPAKRTSPPQKYSSIDMITAAEPANTMAALRYLQSARI